MVLMVARSCCTGISPALRRITTCCFSVSLLLFGRYLSPGFRITSFPSDQINSTIPGPNPYTHKLTPIDTLNLNPRNLESLNPKPLSRITLAHVLNIIPEPIPP